MKPVRTKFEMKPQDPKAPKPPIDTSERDLLDSGRVPIKIEGNNTVEKQNQAPAQLPTKFAIAANPNQIQAAKISEKFKFADKPKPDDQNPKSKVVIGVFKMGGLPSKDAVIRKVINKPVPRAVDNNQKETGIKDPAKPQDSSQVTPFAATQIGVSANQTKKPTQITKENNFKQEIIDVPQNVPEDPRVQGNMNTDTSNKDIKMEPKRQNLLRLPKTVHFEMDSEHSNPPTSKNSDSKSPNPYSFKKDNSKVQKSSIIPEIFNFLSLPEITEMIVNPKTLEFLFSQQSLLPSHPFYKKKTTENDILSVKRSTIKAEDKTFILDHKQSVDLLSVFSLKEPNLTVDKNGKRISQGLITHINGYLNICVYLAKVLNKEEHFGKLWRLYVEANELESSSEVADDLFTDKVFLKDTLVSLLELDELLVFDHFFQKIPNIIQFIDKYYFDCFSENSRNDMQLRFFRHFHSYLLKKPIKTSHSLQSKGFSSGKSACSQNIDGTNLTVPEQLITTDQLVNMTKDYFECSQENKLLLEIFSSMQINGKGVMHLLLETGDEERIVRVVREANLNYLLDPEELVKRKLFQTLILFDKNELINVLNMDVFRDDKKEGKSIKSNVYSEMCRRIKAGIDVEGLCNVIIYVSETYWDMAKLLKFYGALSKLLRALPKDNDEPTWLVYLKNPPLFFINLLYFFHQTKKQLDYKNREISALTEDMLDFCLCYIQYASEENFKMNLFDKDGKEMQFLNYAMLLGEMKILETERIENLLEEMWDVNRASMQTISSFMRVDSMKNAITTFSFKVFTKDYSTPIEKDDTFQMEYRFVMNSVLMKVISEIFWPCIMIVIEFVFSMQILQEYKSRNNQASETWLMDHYNLAPVFSIIHIFLRASQIISFFFKALAIRSLNRGGKTLLNFYKLMLLLYFLQMAVWPLIFINYFNFFSIVQMMLVVVQVFYVLYKTLSLDDIGVTIRIFGRMALVVLTFGTLSFSIITLIAYCIYIVFTMYSQPISGQIYSDINLFSDLYQGMLTLYEFVFGAVVLVRPYTQGENLYTRSMTFIMTLFSFFGNIMLANMLVAFLTSQFNEISQNAKYLTMNMQYELIQIYTMQDMDGLLSLPFFLTVPCLPMLLPMYRRGDARRRNNQRLRKIVHVVTYFIPTFCAMMVKLLLLSIWRYLTITVDLILYLPFRPLMNPLYLLSWLIGGPVLLAKLYCEDLMTVGKIMLDMKKTDKVQSMNYDLEEESRNNLVRVFTRMQRVMNLMLARGKKVVTVNEFLKYFSAVGMSDKIASAIMEDGEDIVRSLSTFFFNKDQSDNAYTASMHLDENSNTNSFNIKYRQSDKLIAPILAEKFADPDPDTGILTLDLSFMKEKLKNNITTDNIHRLVSFDKSALMKASSHISNPESDDMKFMVSGLSTLTNKTYRQLTDLRNLLTACKAEFGSA